MDEHSLDRDTHLAGIANAPIGSAGSPSRDRRLVDDYAGIATELEHDRFLPARFFIRQPIEVIR